MIEKCSASPLYTGPPTPSYIRTQLVPILHTFQALASSTYTMFNFGTARNPIASDFGLSELKNPRSGTLSSYHRYRPSTIFHIAPTVLRSTILHLSAAAPMTESYHMTLCGIDNVPELVFDQHLIGAGPVISLFAVILAAVWASVLDAWGQPQAQPCTLENDLYCVSNRFGPNSR